METSAQSGSSGARDLAGMRRAVAAFLRAAGLDLEGDPNLAETPELVARAWAEEFLEGYTRDPLEALGAAMAIAPGEAGALVCLDGIDFVSVCPHHLLPYRGRARIAYLPSDKLVGFGQIVQMLEALSHRLILQEQLAQEAARILRRGVNARAVGVRLEAVQSCLALRGERQFEARAICEAYAGEGEALAEIRQALR